MLKVVLAFLILFFTPKVFSQTAQSDSTKPGIYYFKTDEKVTVKGYFKNTKRHKIWTWYNADGNFSKQIKYKQGKQIWIIYYEKNKPWLKIDRYVKRHIIRACDCREGG